MQVQKKRLLVATAVAGVAVLLLIGGAVAFVRAGIYNVAADDPHDPATYAVLEQLRKASIDARASKLEVPGDLTSQARITQGAGNYNAMCMGCHLAPGMAETELSKGLYPAPPDLTKETVDAVEAFWVIKHGIKASGMPAWGKSMDDEYIWNMAAFIRQLPRLTPEQYRDMVARSGGHSHGGGETRPHAHGAEAKDDHHGASAAAQASATGTAADMTHTHADGQQHVHDAPAATKAAAASRSASRPTSEPKPAPEPKPEAEDHDAHEHQH